MPTRIIAGSVDHVISHTDSASSNPNANQMFFTSLYKFLNGPCTASNITELVALQTGSSATGTGYYDETGRFGENAFAVFKFLSGSSYGGKRRHDFYVMIQWADAVNFGTSPGNPGLVNAAAAADGVGIAGAYMLDGTNPWNGTMLKNGNDTKGATVWNTGSFNLVRSNMFGGTHVATKENTIKIIDLALSAGNSLFYHMIADNDTLFITLAYNQTTRQNYHCLIGAYTPIPALSGTIMPMMAHQFSLANGGSLITSTAGGSFDRTTAYGSTAGAPSTTYEGIVYGSATTTGSLSQIWLDFPQQLNDGTAGANVQVGSGTYDIFQNQVWAWSNLQGIVGYTDPYYAMHRNAPNGMKMSGTLNGLEYAVLGTDTLAKILTPWSGSAPFSVTTRTGRQFYYSVNQ